MTESRHSHAAQGVYLDVLHRPSHPLAHPTLITLQTGLLSMQICMGTFILTFIGRSFSIWVEESKAFAKFVSHREARRKMLVIGYFVTIGLIISVFGLLTIPYIVREGADFIHRLQAENIWYVSCKGIPSVYTIYSYCRIIKASMCGDTKRHLGDK